MSIDCETYDCKVKPTKKEENFEVKLLGALQNLDISSAKNAVSSLTTEANAEMISKALVQAMYLLWIKTTQANTTSVRTNELEVLRIAVSELITKLGANPVLGLPTAFHYCMQISDIGLLNLFFDYGIDPCYSDSMKNTPLHLACMYVCDPAVVLHILQRDGNTYNTCNTAGLTPLMIALDKFWGSVAHERDVWESVHKAIDILLSRTDIDLNISDFEGRTPLAIQFENVHTTPKSEVLDCAFQISQKMLQCGANINLENCRGETALRQVFQNDWLNEEYMVQFLRLLLEWRDTDVDAKYVRNGNEYTLLSELSSSFFATRTCAEKLTKYLCVMNEVVLAGAKIDPLMESPNSGVVTFFAFCWKFMYDTLLGPSIQELLKNILANFRLPVLMSAVTNFDNGRTPFTRVYPFYSHVLNRNEFGKPNVLDVVKGLFRCGVSRKQFITLLHTWKYEILVYEYDLLDPVVLWYSAGIHIMHLQRFLLSVLQECFHWKNFKALDCFLREKIVNTVLLVSNKVRHPVSYVGPKPAELVRNYVRQFFKQPLSLQICCVSVFRTRLEPNVFRGVEDLRYNGRMLPLCIKRIILNEKLAHEAKCFY